MANPIGQLHATSVPIDVADARLTLADYSGRMKALALMSCGFTAFDAFAAGLPCEPYEQVALDFEEDGFEAASNEYYIEDTSIIEDIVAIVEGLPRPTFSSACCGPKICGLRSGGYSEEVIAP